MWTGSGAGLKHDGEDPWSALMKDERPRNVLLTTRARATSTESEKPDYLWTKTGKKSLQLSL